MKKEMIKEIISYVIILILVLLIKGFIVTEARVNGDSMHPTLNDKEIMILNRLRYVFNDINRFDIIVFRENNEKLIKRVIGLPNEEIEYANGKLYVDGNYLEEEYLVEVTGDFKFKTNDDCYLVLGDNRDVSYDGRYFGCITKKNILGKANLVIYPFNKIRYQK